MSRTEVKLEFIGTAGVNSFIANTSSPRAVMDFSHFSARVPLISPDERLIKSGIEYELGKYLDDVRVDNNCIVKGVVPRFKEYGYEPPSYTLFTEFERDGKLFIDVIEVPTYRSNHSFFGFQLHPTEALNNLEYGSILEEGTQLAKTASYGREGSMNFGLNANVAIMSHPSVADDGFVISESFAKRAASTSITKRIINVSKNTILLNLNGDEKHFKFLPDIGEKVRADGLLCATRERNDWFSISDMSDRSLNELDVIFDTSTYVNVDSVVLDIKVIRGNSKPEFSAKMTEQLDHYTDMLLNYYSLVTSKFEQLLAEKKALYGGLDSVRLTPRTHRFITDSYVKLNAATNRKNTISYRKLPIDQYRIEVTTMSTVIPNLGHKLTDIHAAKGVVCLILPDEKMPVDKNGVRADLITDSTSTISRMNIGRAYESYMGATSRDNRTRIIEAVRRQFGESALKRPPEGAVNYVCDYLHGLYAMINPEMTGFLESLNPEERILHTQEVLNTGLFIYYPPDNSRNITDVISDIEASIYKPLNDKVTYVNGANQTVETNENIQLGVIHVMILEKIANLYSGVSSSRVNNFGFPVKGSNFDKFRYPHSLTPAKLLAETENRILISYVGPEAVADMMDLALNPSSHKTVYKNMLQNPYGYDAGFDVNRRDIPYGETKSLQTLNHLFTAAGFDMTYEEDIHAQDNR